MSGPLPDGDAPIVGQGELGTPPYAARAAEVTAATSGFETDPVCGSRIGVRYAARSEYNGHAYYFDSLECQRRFDEMPARFTKSLDRRRSA